MAAGLPVTFVFFEPDFFVVTGDGGGVTATGFLAMAGGGVFFAVTFLAAFTGALAFFAGAGGAFLAGLAVTVGFFAGLVTVFFTAFAGAIFFAGFVGFAVTFAFFAGLAVALGDGFLGAAFFGAGFVLEGLDTGFLVFTAARLGAALLEILAGDGFAFFAVLALAVVTFLGAGLDFFATGFVTFAAGFFFAAGLAGALFFFLGGRGFFLLMAKTS